jgi:serine/threonine protein kinase
LPREAANLRKREASEAERNRPAGAGAQSPEAALSISTRWCHTSANPHMSLAIGTRLGPYEVLAPLGAGGMGEVYRARDARLGREVAVKVLPASLATDSERLLRFEREARAASALNHPNILSVYDIGTHAGAPYVVSELLEGETLRERIGNAPLPRRKAIEYATQLARGLAAAHDRHIVHRDLKPDNVFVTRDGRVKILDFGLAKVTEVGVPIEAETALAAGAAPGPPPARYSVRWGTCRPSRCAASTSTTAPTSSRSASCSTRC